MTGEMTVSGIPAGLKVKYLEDVYITRAGDKKRRVRAKIIREDPLMETGDLETRANAVLNELLRLPDREVKAEMGTKKLGIKPFSKIEGSYCQGEDKEKRTDIKVYFDKNVIEIVSEGYDNRQIFDFLALVA